MEQTLVINGAPAPWRPGLTVATILDELYGAGRARQATPSRAVVVEVNEVILAGDTYGQTVLNPGDVVEIVQFVGGG